MSNATAALKSRRLLRSISRLHRAALGEPGLNAEICRDLSSVLRSVSRHRQTALRCGDQPSRLATLENSLEEVEACLISLIEFIEERAFETLEGRAIAASPFEDMKELFPGWALRAAIWRAIFLFFKRSALTCRTRTH